MTSAHDFLTEFMKQIVHNVEKRPQIVQEWTAKLEAREIELARQFYERFEKEVDELGERPEDLRPWDILEAGKKALGLE